MTTVTAPWGQWPEPAKAGARRSILSSDLVVEGDVRSDGPLEVQGQVVGQVKAPDLLISSTGTVDGSAIALDLKVRGKMSGAIEARQVSLLAGAVVLADVTHQQIAIEAGAQIEGQLKRAR